LQVAPDALSERKQGIPDAVIMERGIGFEHAARLFHRIPQ